VPEELLERARDTFTAYRGALAEIRNDPYDGDLPQDPSYLSWTLAACAPLPLHERQALLEAEDAAHRLRLVTDLLRTELRAMRVFPSLPATDVARTRWSPN
jgi:Lon protease-like protein